MKESQLLQTMDASIWAKEFMSIFGNRKEDIDESLMLGWLANAIMTGYDTAKRKDPPPDMSYEEFVKWKKGSK